MNTEDKILVSKIISLNQAFQQFNFSQHHSNYVCGEQLLKSSCFAIAKQIQLNVVLLQQITNKRIYNVYLIFTRNFISRTVVNISEVSLHESGIKFLENDSFMVLPEQQQQQGREMKSGVHLIFNYQNILKFLTILSYL